MKKLKEKKCLAFERYKLEKISREKFLEIKDTIEKDMNFITVILNELDRVKEVCNGNELTKELLEKYVDSVYCMENEVVKIVWKESN